LRKVAVFRGSTEIKVTMSGSEGEEELGVPMVTLIHISPVIPEDSKERAELLEDLSQMGCIGLIDRPWSFRDEGMVREVL
jgi:hypothetical protein